MSQSVYRLMRAVEGDIGFCTVRCVGGPMSTDVAFVEPQPPCDHPTHPNHSSRQASLDEIAAALDRAEIAYVRKARGEREVLAF